MLPPNDIDYLKSKSPDHAIQAEGGTTCVLIRAYPLPKGFDRESSDLLIRLSPGYPDVPPDMWWFDPPVVRTDRAEIPATQAREGHLGRQWQRWSRHLPPGLWKSGIDSLESYLAIVRRELLAAAPPGAA